MPHHLHDLLLALLALVILAAIARIIIGDPRAARHRVRVLRWRIRLYLRPGPGYANMLELIVRWSRLRAVHTGGRPRPSLPWWARLILPVTVYAVRLGRAHFGRRVIASMEDQTLIVAAPRTGKSGLLADRIIDHPGAVISTTTRTDLYDNTSLLRGQHGELHVFNPEGIGGLASTFRWNPLQDCDQPAIALQRAASLTAATDSKGLQDMAFWIGKATSALASLMHAAALDDRSMLDVYRWAHGIDDTEPEHILATYPGAGHGWLGPVQELRRPGKTADSIRMTVTRALAWLADPAVAAATSPGPGEGFDIANFVAGPNTLYMIGTGREEASIAPLFRAFAEYVHAGAALTGSLQPHHRLDAPLLIALDEVTQICPVPLPLWMADSAGKGILIVAVCHGLAQLEERWHGPGARAIWDTAGIKIILGGISDPDTLDRLSRLCGDIELRTHTRTIGEDGRRARTATYQHVRVLPPELLRTLPDRRALIIRSNLSPVVVRLRMAWRRWDCRRARRFGITPHRPIRTRAATWSQPPKPRSIESDQVAEWLADSDYFYAGESDVLPASPDASPALPDEPPARRLGRWPQPACPSPADKDAPNLPNPLSTDPPIIPAEPPPFPADPPARPSRPWDPPADAPDPE